MLQTLIHQFLIVLSKHSVGKPVHPRSPVSHCLAIPSRIFILHSHEAVHDHVTQGLPDDDHVKRLQVTALRMLMNLILIKVAKLAPYTSATASHKLPEATGDLPGSGTSRPAADKQQPLMVEQLAGPGTGLQDEAHEGADDRERLSQGVQRVVSIVLQLSGHPDSDVRQVAVCKQPRSLYRCGSPTCSAFSCTCLHLSQQLQTGCLTL